MKKLLSTSPSPSLLAICIWYMCLLLCLVGRSQAQNTTNATTDPSEVSALNSIFQKWGISASSTWNTTGDPCTGSAIDDSLPVDLLTSINPAIKCQCNLNNGTTTCHITAMKVFALDVIGTIPEELGNLTKLSDLNLGQNYLTGPLPAFIGNLTDMQYLTFGINALSGPIPKEIGNLRKLISLGLGTNNFSGSLPPEFGNLVTLEQLYMDSSGVGGEIPSTFANLVNLEIVWASDNAFNGTIPDFIGTWTNLTALIFLFPTAQGATYNTVLSTNPTFKDGVVDFLFFMRLQGNSFQGSIPLSFSNLTLLRDLRISDISNGSSSLAFISNMKSLSNLVLRNNMISGTIPSNIGDYQSLQQLDLSFNNLTGQIPSSLFSLSLLSTLFLGNNSLSGTLPSSKSSSLLIIDLSYNQLSGTFPSWVTQSGLQLNLMANNFVFDNSNSSTFPGLKCLQQNFPCNRDSPIYSSFAIHCGGERMTSNGTDFDWDNKTLGAASYYVPDTKKWAVSSVGTFADSSRGDAYNTRFPLFEFSKAFDLGLYQSARLSPVSLRYYGLGLMNGNYTVSLKFADTEFPDSASWRYVGRRVFDIYLQGSLQLKDFDIRKDAAAWSISDSKGITVKAVQKELKANVSNNILEIHLFWAGKGTCCVPSQGTYGPSISAISVIPDFDPNISPPAISTKKNQTDLVVGFAVAFGFLTFVSVFVVFIWRCRSKWSSINEDEEFLGVVSRANTFSHAELKKATECFNQRNMLGQGGFGPVYKGTLPDGQIVAVKQLSVASHQGKNQFIAEIAAISAVQHRNLVKLYGCCIEGNKRLLVYEFLENGSLDQALSGKRNLHLNWPNRFEICLGTARGLAYLHEESRPRIVHRDIKSSNILLDAELNPKISDFGLAKLYGDKVTHISTRVAGTIGYLAPEYAMRGHLTEKADVYGFGVVVLELLSGRQNSSLEMDVENMYLLEWAWHLFENNRALELVDPSLSEFDQGQAIRMIGVALLCIQASPTLRPPMSRVFAMLLGDIEVSAVTSKPGYLTDLPLRDVSSFMSESTCGASTNVTTNSQLFSSSSSKTVVQSESLPKNATGPLLLHETEGDEW